MELHNTDEQEPPSPGEQEAKTEPAVRRDKERKEHDEQLPPSIPIVRTSTPRLSSSKFAAEFPPLAPAAPPVPEEPETGQDASSVAVVSGAAAPTTAVIEPGEADEFAWLFEYGLEMESAYLNSPERLNGLAHRYGPAVVRGYELHGVELSNGRVAPTLVKCEDQEQEVWGILYRVPRRLLAHAGSAPAPLDVAHPTPAFVQTRVRAQEIYHDRVIDCITYIASPSTANQWTRQIRLDGALARRLLRIGKQQDLPATYLAQLAAALVPLSQNENQQEPFSHQATQEGHKRQEEQDTEPLPALAKDSTTIITPIDTRREPTTSFPVPPLHPAGWLFALSFYLVLLLVAALALAVLQALGLAGTALTTSFTPLGAPWYVPFYGLVGGCISAMLSLGKLPAPSSREAKALPHFVIVTWFARPFAGAFLAILAYFLLNSGLFLLSLVPAQRYAASAFVAAIAGLCEGRILFRL